MAKTEIIKFTHMRTFLNKHKNKIVFISAIFVAPAILLIIFLFLIGGFWLYEGDFSRVPKNQSISWLYNICIVSTGNCGSGDYKYVFTIKCSDYDEIVNSNELECTKDSQIYDRKIDMVFLNECESLDYKEVDGDEPIWQFSANKLCLWLRDKKRLENYKSRYYTIDTNGRFESH